ncbi:MAG TPA: hypothetical protein VF482_19605 [Trebonia sp.]
MSYQDPPRRQRLSRYPALAQYEDSYQSYQDPQSGHSRSAGYPYQSGTGYQDGYSGSAGLPGRGTREQRPPWDEPAQQTSWDTPAQRTTRGEFGQQARRETTAQGDTDVPRRASGPFFAVPDDEEGTGRRRRARGRGRLAGSVAGFLAAAVAIGVANLVAAFVRPQASPVIAVGGWFIDHTPSWLKEFAIQKFGQNDKTMLLLGMYVTIAIIAIVIGMLAWRRIGIGVAGIGLFGLFGAFIAITRPESHVTDVIPSIVGGIVGIAAIVWLVRVGTASAWTDRTADTRRRAAWTGGNS